MEQKVAHVDNKVERGQLLAAAVGNYRLEIEVMHDQTIPPTIRSI